MGLFPLVPVPLDSTLTLPARPAPLNVQNVLVITPPNVILVFREGFSMEANVRCVPHSVTTVMPKGIVRSVIAGIISMKISIHVHQHVHLN